MKQKTQVVNMLVNIKKKYGKYRFFITGSVARKEKNPKDIDINILPYDRNYKEWFELLKLFDGHYVEGKRIDAQIIPDLEKVIYNGYKGYLTKWIIKNNKLSDKTSFVANEKARLRGVHKLPFMYMEI